MSVTITLMLTQDYTRMSVTKMSLCRGRIRERNKKLKTRFIVAFNDKDNKTTTSNKAKAVPIMPGDCTTGRMP